VAKRWRHRKTGKTPPSRRQLQAAGRYIATAVTATFDADPAERFTYGLHAFLDGIRRELDQPPPNRPTMRKPPQPPRCA
jgi:hypothetical protein